MCTLHLSHFVQGKCRRIQVCSRGCYRVTCIDYLVVITSLTSAPLQHVRENVITLLKWLSSNIVSRVTVLMWSLTLLFYFLFDLALFHILYFIYKVYLVDFICIDYSYSTVYCFVFFALYLFVLWIYLFFVSWFRWFNMTIPWFEVRPKGYWANFKKTIKVKTNRWLTGKEPQENT